MKSRLLSASRWPPFSSITLFLSPSTGAACAAFFFLLSFFSTGPSLSPSLPQENIRSCTCARGRAPTGEKKTLAYTRERGNFSGAHQGTTVHAGLNIASHLHARPKDRERTSGINAWVRASLSLSLPLSLSLFSLASDADFSLSVSVVRGSLSPGPFHIRSI